ncbi:hypothetical protein PIB30_083333 [Stylosanthes scabra]|uniref:Uncharacterized protein n=1 Tax=Stylosanthes scabra TaxID=79078 RepID=A0ABU6SUD6_9FABA|nr:hypothetical protein [Stylosanthes scabra]
MKIWSILDRAPTPRRPKPELRIKQPTPRRGVIPRTVSRADRTGFPPMRFERIGQRIDSESILHQFSTVHRRLPIAITFDPELRLTHRLRLLEAYSIPFDSTPHLRYGYHEILLISNL